MISAELDMLLTLYIQNLNINCLSRVVDEIKL